MRPVYLVGMEFACRGLHSLTEVMRVAELPSARFSRASRTVQPLTPCLSPRTTAGI